MRITTKHKIGDRIVAKEDVYFTPYFDNVAVGYFTLDYFKKWLVITKGTVLTYGKAETAIFAAFHNADTDKLGISILPEHPIMKHFQRV